MSDSIFYNNIKGLRNSGVVHQYTDKELDEYIKCSQDVLYFFENYVKIIHQDHGLIQFKPYDFQKRFIKSFQDNRFTIGKVGRQMGKTTVTAAYVLWFILFHSEKNVAILANKEATAIKILRQIKEMYMELPFFMQQGIEKWNETFIILENKCQVVVSATTANAIRGMSIALLVLDEAAFIPPKMEEAFFASIWPTISSGKKTRVIFISTPKGFNRFYHFWDQAVQGKNDFVPIEVHWSEVPGRDQAWADEQRKSLGEILYNQEVLCSFLGSANTLISSSAIQNMSVQDPIMQDEHLSIYKSPEFNHRYMIIADPTRGTGRDDSAFIVFDITTYPITIAATYKNAFISPLLLPTVIKSIAETYNMADVLVETNDNGAQVADVLFRELEYENVIIPTKRSNKTEFGIRTTISTKRIGCSNFKDLVENQKLIVNCLALKQQISNFVQDNKGSFSADAGYHDDLVMCCVILGYFMTTNDFKGLHDLDMRAAIRENNQQAIEDSLLPFGFIFNGTESDEDDFFQ